MGIPLPIPLIVFICLAVAVALFLDKRSWRQKSTESLREMALGGDWRRWEAGLRELQRRGDSLEGIAQHLAPHLLSDSALEREAARAALVRYFPFSKDLLKGFSVSAPPANTAEIVAQVSSYAATRK
jgi:hypothetical protein